MDVVLILLVLLVPYLFAAGSTLWTVAHTVDEVLSERLTIWEYLADVYRPFPRLGYAAGLAALLAFGGAQVWLAWAGYAGGSAAALLALAAVRLGDCVVSHWGPWLAGRRPNPGLGTTPLYAIDAALAGTTLAGWWY